MSFSQDTKQELSKINNLAKKDQVKQEFLGYLISCNISVFNNKLIRYATENEYNINRFSKLLNNLNINYTIDIEGKTFAIKFKLNDIIKDLVKIEDNEIILNFNQIQGEEAK